MSGPPKPAPATCLVLFHCPSLTNKMVGSNFANFEVPVSRESTNEKGQTNQLISYLVLLKFRLLTRVKVSVI